MFSSAHTLPVCLRAVFTGRVGSPLYPARPVKLHVSFWTPVFTVRGHGPYVDTGSVYPALAYDDALNSWSLMQLSPFYRPIRVSTLWKVEELRRQELVNFNGGRRRNIFCIITNFKLYFWELPSPPVTAMGKKLHKIYLSRLRTCFYKIPSP